MSSGRIANPQLVSARFLRGGREEWRFAFALESRRLMGVSHSGHRNISNWMERGARLRGPTWKGAVCARSISVQSPIDVDQTTLTGPTLEAASKLGVKRLKFNWDEQSRG